jgi:hypothetical protein
VTRYHGPFVSFVLTLVLVAAKVYGLDWEVVVQVDSGALLED